MSSKTMRVLLVANPKTTLGFDRIMRLPNLGLCSIAANLDRNICDVKLVDLVIAGRKPGIYLRHLLKQYQPDVVGFSCMIFQYQEALELAKITKEFDKNIKVVMGGYYPTVDYEAILERDDMDYIDFVVRNEGENAFNKLIKELNGKNNFDNVPNLSYRDNGSIRHNPSEDLLHLDEIRLPDRNVRVLKKGFHLYGTPTDVVETSRGCLNKCKFCNIQQMYGRSFRKYKIERVIRDLRDVQKRGAKAVFIADDNITVDGERYKELCQAIIGAKLNSMKYLVQVTIKGIKNTPGLVSLMVKSGVNIVLIGIENVSRDNLDFLDKSIQFKNSETHEVIKEFRKRDVLVGGTFIIGNPGDTEEIIYKNFEYAKNIRVDLPIFLILTPCPKTPVRKELEEQGLITNLDDYSKYDFFQANVKTKYLSSERLHELREEIGFRTFSDPSRAWKLLKNMPLSYTKYFFEYVKNEPQEMIGYVRGIFK